MCVCLCVFVRECACVCESMKSCEKSQPKVACHADEDGAPAPNERLHRELQKVLELGWRSSGKSGKSSR